jgi:hypothetical protein
MFRELREHNQRYQRKREQHLERLLQQQRDRRLRSVHRQSR